MHINPIPGYSGAGTSVKRGTGKLAEVLVENSMKDLQALTRRIESLSMNSEHTFVPLAFYSYFTDTVKQVAKKNNIDLIIMGTKGASGLKKATVGSNTGDVITKVTCPLLAVPEDAVYEKPKEIAFPTDFRLGSDLKVLDKLIEMATMNDASLSILNVLGKGEDLDQEQQKNKEILHNYLAGIKHSFHTLTGTKLDVSVQCFTESRDIEMIAMVAKNLNFFQRILFRPAVEQISYHTKIPFLVLHE
jgi:nucleotide-binding universal stress UspA family protein